jgi:hypothetical protein
MRYLPREKSSEDYLIGNIDTFNHYSSKLTYDGFDKDEYIMWKHKWKEFYKILTIEIQNIKKNRKYNAYKQYRIKYNTYYHNHFIALAQDMMFWKNEIEERKMIF